MVLTDIKHISYIGNKVWPNFKFQIPAVLITSFLVTLFLGNFSSKVFVNVKNDTLAINKTFNDELTVFTSDRLIQLTDEKRKSEIFPFLEKIYKIHSNICSIEFLDNEQKVYSLPFYFSEEKYQNKFETTKIENFTDIKSAL